MSETQEQYGNGAEKRPLTAVEWLVEMVSKMGYVSTDIFEQAKEMEKEQIIEAFKHGELPPLFVNYNAESYYNEIYGKP